MSPEWHRCGCKIGLLLAGQKKGGIGYPEKRWIWQFRGWSGFLGIVTEDGLLGTFETVTLILAVEASLDLGVYPIVLARDVTLDSLLALSKNISLTAKLV
jgi:hypothetical protein